MNRIKKLLGEYNGTCYELDDQPRAISDVLSPTSYFWGGTASNKTDSSSVPYKMKKDIIQAFMLMKRSKEELELLKDDMCASVSYWFSRTECIANRMAELDQDDNFSRGARCLLTKLKWEADSILLNNILSFRTLIELPNTVPTGPISHSYVQNSDSDTSCDSDIDESDDDDMDESVSID